MGRIEKVWEGLAAACHQWCGTASVVASGTVEHSYGHAVIETGLVVGLLMGITRQVDKIHGWGDRGRGWNGELPQIRVRQV